MKLFIQTSVRIISFLSCFLVTILPSSSEELQIGVSVDTVPVDSSFSGMRIFVFGSIDKADALDLVASNYSIVVAVTGPRGDLVVRKKERTFGIWTNAHARTYSQVPGYYAVVSGRPLGEVADDQLLKDARLGIANIDYNLKSSGAETFILPEPDFSSALRRIRLDEELFSEKSGKVDYLGKSLFRARIELPANVPIGKHIATTYLFRDNQLLDQKSVNFDVRKVGFERWLYNLAYEQSLLYGLMAVLLAILTGWSANLVLRKD